MSGQASRQLLFVPGRLVEELDRHVLTNSEAARLLGVTEKTLLRWRHGVSQPHRSNVRRMGEVFECDPRSFVTTAEEAAA